MRLKHDPFPFLFAKGDSLTQLACLQFFGLEDSPAARDCLFRVIRNQRSDGAFPSQMDQKQWSMRETVRSTLLMLEVGLPPSGVNVERAVNLILRHQNRDGGWCENRALILPPGETWMSGKRSMTWLTVDAVDLLRKVEMGESAAGQAALSWLRKMQDQHGGWPSLVPDVDESAGPADPDASAQVTFLMGDLYGEEDPVYRRGRECFERHLDECARDAARGYAIGTHDGERKALDVYHLTHLLLSWWLDPPRRFQCGYDATDPRVRSMMQALLQIQQLDGGWRPFFSSETSPVYTLLAVKVLVLSGMLPRDRLQTSVERYAVSRRN
jgi:hypothetical protein